MDALASDMGEEGKYAEMVAYTTSTTHMEYANAEKARQEEAYPNMELINDGAVPTCESEESIDTAYERAKEVLKANPDLKGFTGVASTDCPGIAKAVEELGLDVKVVGVGTPNEFKPVCRIRHNLHNQTVGSKRLRIYHVQGCFHDPWWRGNRRGR